MTVLDLIQLQIDLDVMDDVTGELYIAFVGPQLLTREGEKEFADVLTMEVTINNDETLAEIHVDGPEGVWQQRLSNAKRFFYGAAGYVSEMLYDRWFKDDEED